MKSEVNTHNTEVATAKRPSVQLRCWCSICIICCLAALSSSSSALQHEAGKNASLSLLQAVEVTPSHGSLRCAYAFSLPACTASLLSGQHCGTHNCLAVALPHCVIMRLIIRTCAALLSCQHVLQCTTCDCSLRVCCVCRRCS